MELLTVAELANKVKLSPSRILEKARRGEIPRIKLGKGPKAPVRFDLEAVLKALQRDDVPGIGE
jgi:Helix-turn-helix domain